jgi:hypothetical protein
LRDSQVTEKIHVDGDPLLKPLGVYLLSIWATAFTSKIGNTDLMDILFLANDEGDK